MLVIDSLKQTTVNDYKWSAELHSMDSTPAAAGIINHDGNLNLGIQMVRNLADWKRQTLMKAVCLEDLEYLHNALMHLEAHPNHQLQQ